MLTIVPYLRKEQIERDAAELLAEYEQARGVKIKRAMPIEDIVEKYLKLGIEFDDTHHLFGVPRSGLGFDPDILGAIFFDERRVVIDESLDPEGNPNKEGRYRFTLAHEVGHWRLHRRMFAKGTAQVSLFNEPAPPSVVCQSSQAKEPVEWQADIFAECLLMPRALVLAAWEDIFPDRPFHTMDRSRRETVAKITDAEERKFEANIEEWKNECAMEDLARPFAKQFLVSPIAMRIRLEHLGLLHREVPRQRTLAGDA